MLVRIVSCRVTILWVIWRDPEMLRGEFCTLEHTGFWMRKGQDIFPRHQLVSYRLSEAIEDGRIDHLPVASRQRVNHLLRLCFGRQQRRFGEVRITVRVFGTQRLSLCM